VDVLEVAIALAVVHASQKARVSNESFEGALCSCLLLRTIFLCVPFSANSIESSLTHKY
jgi:hypothetical protein